MNIVNPPAAPDPVGLAAAFKVLGTPNIFRDMSGVQELSQLLQTLANDATSLAKPTGGAAGATGKPTASSTGGSGIDTGGGGGGGQLASRATPQSVAEVNDLASGIRKALPPAQANPLVDKLYQNVVDKTGPEASAEMTGIGSDALAKLTQAENARRRSVPPEKIKSFTPTNENTIVAWAKEEVPPAGLTVVNWAHDGVAHYGHIRAGKMIGDSFHPIRSPQDINQLVLHETAGWAQIGAGIEPAVGAKPAQPLSVQFTIGPDGTAYQHNDIAEKCAHAGGLNPLSIGIEFTNWGPFFVGQKGAAPLAKGVTIMPVTDLQTGVAVGGTVTDDRERIPIRWLNGKKGDGALGDYYVMPPASQFEGLALLVGWLTGGVFQAAIDIPPLWRQLQNHPDPAKRKRPDPYLFEMSQDPAWTRSDEGGWTGVAPTSLPGIFAHRQFSGHQDGAVQGLYTWLRLARHLAPTDAYQRVRTLITDDSLQVSAAGAVRYQDLHGPLRRRIRPSGCQPLIRGGDWLSRAWIFVAAGDNAISPAW